MQAIFNTACTTRQYDTQEFREVGCTYSLKGTLPKTIPCEIVENQTNTLFWSSLVVLSRIDGQS